MSKNLITIFQGSFTNDGQGNAASLFNEECTYVNGEKALPVLEPLYKYYTVKACVIGREDVCGNSTSKF